MEARFGLVGVEEIERAKEKLLKSYDPDEGSWLSKKIWFRKPYAGERVQGFTYDHVCEVLEYATIHAIDIFQDIAQVENFAEEHSYIFSEKDMECLESIFKKDKVAYMVDGEICEDEESLCWSKIEDGQYIWHGTLEDAYNFLNDFDNDDALIELLVVGILSL